MVGIVFAFFAFVSMGIVVYTLRQTESIDPQIRAADTQVILPILLDDCNIQFSHECTPTPSGISLAPYLIYSTEKILAQSANTKLKSYTESVAPTFFTDLDGTKDAIPQQNQYTLPEILTYTAINTRIQPKILIALLRIQAPQIWNSSRPEIETMLRQPEPNLASQIKQAAIFIREGIRRERTFPSTLLIVSTKMYRFDTNLNIGSKVIYNYLAQHATSVEEFESWVGFTSSPQSSHLWSVWKELYGETAFSSQPHFLPEE